ncbi:MAG TPA: rod shape-determining protein [Kribbella sp.]
MRRRHSLAVDLGSARTRVWTPAGRLVVDTRTRRGLVSRGKVLDPDGLRTLVGAAVAGPVRRPRVLDAATAVVTTPVLCDDAHRDDVHAVLHGLGMTTVVMIDAVKAAAFGAGADLTEPLLVIDLGAQLTEVALLGGGAVVEARRTEFGLEDVRTVSPIVEVVGDWVLDLLRGPHGPQVVDALDRGVLLVGGGALRPEITYKLGDRLGAPVCPAPAPHTAAVRGAATALESTCRHPSSPTAP